MILVKMHRSQEGTTLLAVCDSELLGKRYEEKSKVLDMQGDFYAGEEQPLDSIADLMRNADSLSLAGEKSIELAIKEGLLESGEVHTTQGIPHADIVNSD